MIWSEQLVTRVRIGTLVSTVVVVMLVSSLGFAKPPPSDEDRRQAIVHFKLGNEAFEAGDLKAAHSEYQRAWRLANTFDIACNLGRTEAELDEFRDAAEHLAYCLDNFSASARPEMRAAEGKLKQVFAEVRQHVAELVLRVDPDGAQVRVDGALIGKTPLRRNLYLEAGEHQIDVRMVGHRAVKRRLPTVRGERQELMLTLEPVGEDSAAVPPSSSADRSREEPGPVGAPEDPGVDEPRITSRAMALVAGSVLTAARLGIGAGYWLHSRKLEDDRTALESRAESRVGPNGCADNTSAICGELLQASNDRDDARTVAAVGMVSTGLFALGTVATYIWWPTETPSASARADAQVSVAPVVGPRELGVTIRGSL
jgi:hypothetical protein